MAPSAVVASTLRRVGDEDDEDIAGIVISPSRGMTKWCGLFTYSAIQRSGERGHIKV
jgi:hypothetical protein